MKMKKLLAAALAVCMLLTMLPISVFAADVDYAIEISWPDDGEPVISCNGNTVEFNEESGSWKVGDDWELMGSGVLQLYNGTFSVVNEADVPVVIIYPAAILVDGSLDEANVTNRGTIEDGTFNGCVKNDGEITGGTFNDEVENNGEITGGTFFSRDSVWGEGTIDGDAVKYMDEDDSIEWYPLDKVSLEYEGQWFDYRVLLSVKWEDNHNKNNTRPNQLSLCTVDGSKGLANCTLIQDTEDEYDLYDLMLINGYNFEDTWYYDVEYLLPCSLDDVMSENNADAYFTFEVPEGYTASVSGNTVTMKLKEAPKPQTPVVEYEEETYDIVVRVKFDGVDEDEIDFVNAQLLKNGKAYKKAVKVDAKDEWRHEWTDLDDSSKIEWSVTADEIEGYDMEIVNVRANYWTITLSAKDAAVEKANPETGADSFVGAAVALAVCSAVCGAALSLKK